LYYARWDGSFIFASEVKAILQHPSARRALNAEVLPEYLALGYVLPPYTLFDGIHKLAPGHLLMSDESDQRAYWQPNAQIDTSISRQDAAQQTRMRLEAAVEMRMMSDVPLGTFLSGGVDSTTITALTGKFTGQAVKSFTVGFDFPADSYGDQKFNVDLHHARAAADALGCQHRAIVIRHDDLLRKLLPQLVFALDEPIADPAIMQTIFVTALARASGVPVLLSGDGADEIFGGYPFFRQANRVQQYKSLVPATLRRGLIDPLAGRLPVDAIQKLVEKSKLPSAAHHFLTWEANHPLNSIASLLKDSELAQRGSVSLHKKLSAILAPADSARIAEQVGYARLRMWLAENSNTRFDKMSMWMSVEARSPFQDHELVDFALGIPLRHKLPQDGKAVLKDAVADLLPPGIITRKKWGFTPPMSDWLRGPLRPLVDEHLSPGRLAATGLNPDVIQPMVADHMARRGYHLHEIWNVLMLQLWHAIYIDESLAVEGRWSAEELTAMSASPV
jgi:asparagine synthase (glutamine-hydrolysing)